MDKKEVEIKHYPTTLMLADYFTKHLQGNMFRRLMLVIVGHTHINDLILDPQSMSKNEQDFNQEARAYARMSRLVCQRNGRWKSKYLNGMGGEK